jgi:hypothetical protein
MDRPPVEDVKKVERCGASQSWSLCFFSASLGGLCVIAVNSLSENEDEESPAEDGSSDGQRRY